MFQIADKGVLDCKNKDRQMKCNEHSRLPTHDFLAIQNVVLDSR